MYKSVFKPILFLFDPGKVHNLFVGLGRFMGSFALGRFLVDMVYGYHGPDISKVVDGIYYRTPIILSAGFDYNGHLTQILPSVSFGGEEVGSVTAKPCVGNDSVHLTRLPHTRSIIVNKGLKNDGVEVVVARLSRRKKMGDFVVGVSIARTNDAGTSTVEAGIADYVHSLKKLSEVDVADYYTVNVSCPNSFGGETFSSPDLIEKLFAEIDKVPRKKPLYVKMPINVTDNTFVQLLSVLARHNVQGVIIGNLQKDYDTIDKRDLVPDQYRGGLSGKPCEERSNELIALTKTQYKDRFTIVGCGGVFSYEDAREKFDLGADLIQLITGMIYEGPGLMKDICRGIALQKSGK